MRVFALLALAACTNAAVRVRPADLALHAQEITKAGEADVPFEGTTVHVKASERVDVRIADGDTQHLEHLTIGQLVAGCETNPDAKGCLANQALRDPITVRREHHADHANLETGVTFGVMGAAIGSCLAFCQSDADLGRGFEYIGGAVAIMMGAFVLLVALGGRD